MSNRYDSGGTITLQPDTVPTSLTINPASCTIVPSGNRVIASVFTTVGGRVLNLVPTLWTIDDAVNFTLVDNHDGTATITAGANSDTKTTLVRTRYDVGAIHLLSPDTSVACSAFSGMSSAAAAQLVAIGLTGGLSDLTMISHLVPGTTILDSTFNTTQGVHVFENAEGGTALQEITDATATFGKAWRETLAPGFNAGTDVDAATVSAVVLGSPTKVSITEDLTINVTTSPYFTPAGTGTVATAPSPATTGTSLTITNAGDLLSNGGLAIVWPGSGAPDGTNAEVVQWSRPNGSSTSITLDATGPGRAKRGSTARSIANGWKFLEMSTTMTIKWYNGDYSSVNTAFNTPPAGDVPGYGDCAVYDAHTIVFAMDTTGKPAFSGSTPAAVVRKYGGIGGAGFESMPPAVMATLLPRVSYIYWRMQYGSNYICNDGAGSQKGIFVGNKVFDGDFNGGYNPGWIGDTVNSAGAITATVQYTLCDRGNGSPISPPNNFTVNSGDEGRATYKNLESITLWPATPTSDIEQWLFRDGTLVGHLTCRFISSQDGSHRAWRLGAWDINNVYGGGGGIPPRGLTRLTAELFVGGGFVSQNERPNHFDLSCVEGNTPHVGTLIHIQGVLRDGNGQQMDQSPGWDYVGTYSTGAATPDFTITGTNGAVLSGGITRPVVGGVDQSPQFLVPIQLSGTPGLTTITLRLYERALNNKRTGRFVENHIDLTAV